MRTYQQADEIKLIYSGRNYFEVLEQLIDESREVIHLQTYIFEYDETGRRIIAALKRAAERQVQVFVLIDAYGSYPVSRHLKEAMRQAGIRFRLFSPLLSSESIYIGRRLHHKIVVVDKRAALTGGINIANKYSGSGDLEAWLDYGVLTRGAVCEYLHLVCGEFYHRKRIPTLRRWEKQSKPTQSTDPERRVRFRRNDWIKRKNDIHKSYAEALISAEKSIVIVASYFLPGRTFRRLLREASERGVEIKILLAGKSDIASLRLAERYMYDFYLRYNIHIYEWTNSVMHGKAMIVDANWATIGSYNLNFLSHYISIELNTDTRDPAFIHNFSDHLAGVIGNCCQAVELQSASNISFAGRALMWITYNFYRMLMSLMMAGRKYRKRQKR